MSIQPPPHLEKRKLGRSGIDLPPLVFGGNVLGWTADRAASFKLLDTLLDAGFNAIDTADVYSGWVPGHSGGESESVIGEWLQRRGRRELTIVATKVGMKMPDGEGLSRAWILRSVDASLRRLQTDYIDLYQAHRDDETTPLEETLQTFADVIASGKVRAIGASNYGAARLAEALATSARLGLPRYESLQPEYNLVERKKFEDELASLCQREHIGVIPYFALAAGFLTGKYRSKNDASKSPRGAGALKYLDARGLRILEALDDVARRNAATPAQVSIAWLLARPSITAPIASATNAEQLENLVKGATLQLDADAIEALHRASV